MNALITKTVMIMYLYFDNKQYITQCRNMNH